MLASSPGFFRRSSASFQATASARCSAEAHGLVSGAGELEVHVLQRPLGRHRGVDPDLGPDQRARPRRGSAPPAGSVTRSDVPVGRTRDIAGAHGPGPSPARGGRPLRPGPPPPRSAGAARAPCPPRGAGPSPPPPGRRGAPPRPCCASRGRWCAPAPASSRHRVAHGARRLGVQPAGGLVEEEHLRVVHQRPHQGQLLPHALAAASRRARPRGRRARSAPSRPAPRSQAAAVSRWWSLRKKRRFSRAVSRS